MITFSISKVGPLGLTPVMIDRVSLAHGGGFVRDFNGPGCHPEGLEGYRFEITSQGEGPKLPPQELASMTTAEVAEYLAGRIRDEAQQSSVDAELRDWDDRYGDDL